MEEKSLAEALANEIYNRRIGELKRNYRVSGNKGKGSGKHSTAHAKRPKNDFLKNMKVVKGNDGLIHIKGDKSIEKARFNNESVLSVRKFEERAKKQNDINSSYVQKTDAKSVTVVLEYSTEQKEWKGEERYSVSPLGGPKYGNEVTEKVNGMRMTFNTSNEGYHIKKDAPKVDRLIRQSIAVWAMNNGLSVQVESIGEDDE